MRELTKKQKTLLTKWFNEDKTINSVGDLSNEQYERLQEINDTEILYQNINRFLWDLRATETFK